MFFRFLVTGLRVGFPFICPPCLGCPGLSQSVDWHLSCVVGHDWPLTFECHLCAIFSHCPFGSSGYPHVGPARSIPTSRQPCLLFHVFISACFTAGKCLDLLSVRWLPSAVFNCSPLNFFNNHSAFSFLKFHLSIFQTCPVITYTLLFFNRIFINLLYFFKHSLALFCMPYLLISTTERHEGLIVPSAGLHSWFILFFAAFTMCVCF